MTQPRLKSVHQIQTTSLSTRALHGPGGPARPRPIGPGRTARGFPSSAGRWLQLLAHIHIQSSSCQHGLRHCNGSPIMTYHDVLLLLLLGAG